MNKQRSCKLYKCDPADCTPFYKQGRRVVSTSKLNVINYHQVTQIIVSNLILFSLALFLNQGPVSISMTDCPTGRRTILLCIWTNSMGRWSLGRTDHRAYCNRPQGLDYGGVVVLNFPCVSFTGKHYGSYASPTATSTCCSCDFKHLLVCLWMKWSPYMVGPTIRKLGRYGTWGPFN